MSISLGRSLTGVVGAAAILCVSETDRTEYRQSQIRDRSSGLREEVAVDIDSWEMSLLGR